MLLYIIYPCYLDIAEFWLSKCYQVFFDLALILKSIYNKRDIANILYLFSLLIIIVTNGFVNEFKLFCLILLTLNLQDDIITKDTMISIEVKRVDKKTKQVQVRLTPELHNQLKGFLALEGRKLVDFFNEAAQAYIADNKKYNTTISKIMEDKRNG